MLVVFVDIPPDNFTECFGASSYGEIMLFNKTIFEYIRSSVYSFIDDCYVIFSSNKEFYGETEALCHSREALIEQIEKTNENNVVFFFLDSYFEMDNDAIFETEITSEGVLLCDYDGISYGVVLDKNYILNILKNDVNFNLKLLLEFGGLCKNYCISYAQKFSNIKDYKRFCNFAFSSDFNEKLPEIAQGIYSIEGMPSGEYTVIPPVYLGRNVQVERGAVIGPATIIYDDSLVSQNSVVDNSILLSNCYISKDCFLENCICCSNVSVRRSSTLYSGAIIGADSILSEKSNVERDSCWMELSVRNNALNRVIRRSDGIVKNDSGDGIIEITDERFNIICERSGVNSMKILLKASSFEIAQEIISEIDYN